MWKHRFSTASRVAESTRSRGRRRSAASGCGTVRTSLGLAAQFAEDWNVPATYVMWRGRGT